MHDKDIDAQIAILEEEYEERQKREARRRGKEPETTAEEAQKRTIADQGRTIAELQRRLEMIEEDRSRRSSRASSRSSRPRCLDEQRMVKQRIDSLEEGLRRSREERMKEANLDANPPNLTFS